MRSITCLEPRLAVLAAVLIWPMRDRLRACGAPARDGFRPDCKSDYVDSTDSCFLAFDIQAAISDSLHQVKNQFELRPADPEWREDPASLRAPSKRSPSAMNIAEQPTFLEALVAHHSNYELMVAELEPIGYKLI